MDTPIRLISLFRYFAEYMTQDFISDRKTKIVWLGIAFFMFLTILSIYYVADWWDLNKNVDWSWKKLFLLRVCGAALLSMLITVVAYWLTMVETKIKTIFFVWFLFLSALLTVVWPGYLMTDSHAAFLYGLQSPMELWLGFFTPFFYSITIQAIPNIAAIAILQIIIAAAVFTYCIQTLLLVTKKNTPAIVFSLFIIFSPSIIFNLLLLSRDTVFSLLVLWVSAFVIKRYKSREENLSEYYVAGIVAGLIVAIRGDGWLVLAPLVVSLFLITRNRLLILKLSAATFLIITIFGFLLPIYIGYHENEFSYRVANTINPLGYVVQSKNHTDKNGNLALIAQVVDIEKIKREQTPYEITAWWNGKVIKDGIAERQKSDYIFSVGSFLLENVGIYFAGRMETFFAATGFHQNGFRYADTYRTDWRLSPQSRNINLDTGRPFPQAFEYLNGLLVNSTNYHGVNISGSVVFWNFLPWLAILLICIFLYPFIPGIALASFVIVCRVPVVFLLAPASQFKYYLSIELCGPFLFCAGAYLLLRIILGSDRKKPQSVI